MNVIEFKRNGEAPIPPYTPQQPRWWRRRWFKVVLWLSIIACFAFVVTAEYIIRNAEPILRKRVIETLSAQFNAPVELDELHISLVKGVEAEGKGLRILNFNGTQTTNEPGPPSRPMLSVQGFAFRTTLRKLMHSPTRIGTVTLSGLELHIPPGDRRPDLLGPNQKKEPADPDDATIRPKIALVVDQFKCSDAKLFIDSSKFGKDPLEFDIQNLHLQNLGAHRPFSYQAELINPKPVGNIHASGHFGPWNSDDPTATALDGAYRFDHADLNTIKGLGGMLSSAGQFSGVLERINVDGQTDTPDFSLDVSDHPVPLHTKFHAIVDGSTGDTYLQPVQAHMLHSDFTARGKIVSVKGKGHDIALEVYIPNARMEDMLRLGVKTSPPLMNGMLTMQTKLHIPPGNVRVPAKLELAGNFVVKTVKFNNPQFQDKVDGLSARASGHPKDVAQVSTDRDADVRSEMRANFSLGHGLMTVNELHYQIPGALVLMNGVYSIDGNIFEFKGHVRTDAAASQMVTGWKSWLLKPVDPFLKKNGAGLELPISVSGTQGDVHFGLALHGSANESSKDMAADLKNNKQAMLEDAKSKRDREKAEQQQRKAAHEASSQREKTQRKAQKEEEKAERHAAAADPQGIHSEAPR